MLEVSEPEFPSCPNTLQGSTGFRYALLATEEACFAKIERTHAGTVEVTESPH